MAEESVEPEVEMAEPEAEEGVMIEVPDEEETETPEGLGDVPQVEDEVEAEPVEEKPTKVKRPVRTPKVEAPVEEAPPVEEDQEDAEAPEEAPEEEEAGEETVADFAAVLSRLEAIEALLTADPAEADDPAAVEDAVKRAEAAELKLLAFKVGTRHGLSETLIERLRGEDEESLTEDAVKLSGETGSGGGALGKGGLDPDEDVFDPKKFIKNLRKQNHGGL